MASQQQESPLTVIIDLGRVYIYLWDAAKVQEARKTESFTLDRSPDIHSFLLGGGGYSHHTFRTGLYVVLGVLL